MTLGTTPPLIDYVENGVTLVHPVPFQFEATTDVVCTRISGGIETPLALGVDFTVAGGLGLTGTVTKMSAGVVGQLFRIKRLTSRAQPTDYTPGDAFPAETHEHALDRLAAVSEEQDVAIADLGSRVLQLPPGEVAATLPAAADRAGKLLAFDGAGAPVAAAGTLIIITAPTVSPEIFASAKPSGVVGDGTDDGPAFAAMSAFLNAAKSGTIDLGLGATYHVGGQTKHSPGVGLDGVSAGVYRFFPNTPYIIDVNGCTGPVVINYNGATIRCLPGAKYGNFNLDGTPWNNGPTYAGDGAASPYIAMLAIRNCSGPVRGIGTLELDGNIKNCAIGGPWAADGSGRQLPMTGVILQDNTGLIDLDPIKSHHHGLDGMIGDGPGLLTVKEQVTIRGFDGHNNGRQACSLVGGNGWRFVSPKFNQTGKDLGATLTYSAPGAGIDLESEGGKWVINITLDDPEAVDNTGVGLIGDVAGQTQNIVCNGGRLIGTTSWSIWPNRPYMRFNYTLIAGAFAHAHADVDPGKATQFFRCLVTDDVTVSPTGLLYGAGGYTHFDTGGGAQNILLDECRIVKTKSGGDSVNGSFTSTIDGAALLIRNCTVERLAGVVGHLYLYGIYSGERTRLINVIGMPSPEAAALFLVNVGPAIDSFVYDGSLVFGVGPARFAASIDKVTGKLIYRGSKAYDPPNIAVGGQATTTVTVTGAVLGDKVRDITFNKDLQGMVLSGYVSAADTVTAVFANPPAAAGAVDLAAGTLDATVLQK